ncbi:MAG: AbrB/MazE/SpoVT family DNA-binding domain-containing protein [Actinomycetia bacterium]|nr:AbrB/MazE/SpoVT family DNA-binding domain-containing protein [Actinomycetes bacterium]
MRTTIDKAGRVVIPKSFRDSIGLSDGGDVEVIAEDGRIVISPRPIGKRLVSNDGVLVCVADGQVPPLTADQVRDVLEAIRR